MVRSLQRQATVLCKKFLKTSVLKTSEIPLSIKPKHYLLFTGKKKKDGVLLYGDSDLLTYFVFVLAARKFRGEFGTHVNNGADLSGIHIYGLTLFLTS